MDISATRKEFGLSQADIAAKLGVHQTTVMRWERGDLRMRPRDVFAVEVAIGQLKAERAA